MLEKCYLLSSEDNIFSIWTWKPFNRPDPVEGWTEQSRMNCLKTQLSFSFCVHVYSGLVMVEKCYLLSSEDSIFSIWTLKPFNRPDPVRMNWTISNELLKTHLSFSFCVHVYSGLAMVEKCYLLSSEDRIFSIWTWKPFNRPAPVRMNWTISNEQFEDTAFIFIFCTYSGLAMVENVICYLLKIAFSVFGHGTLSTDLIL